MNELLIAALSLFVGGVAGYVVSDFRRWSREYDAWQYAKAQRRVMALVEPPNGAWSNGRWSA